MPMEVTFAQCVNPVGRLTKPSKSRPGSKTSWKTATDSVFPAMKMSAFSVESAKHSSAQLLSTSFHEKGGCRHPAASGAGPARMGSPSASLAPAEMARRLAAPSAAGFAGHTPPLGVPLGMAPRKKTVGLAGGTLPASDAAPPRCRRNWLPESAAVSAALPCISRASPARPPPSVFSTGAAFWTETESPPVEMRATADDRATRTGAEPPAELRDRRDELEKLDQRFILARNVSRDASKDAFSSGSSAVSRGFGLGSYREAVARQKRKAWNSPAKVPKSTCKSSLCPVSSSAATPTFLGRR
mmetsp:Transcript_5566/g.18499  ORF Transcript_5566/g.18499 Transcript_5566/m.18499 type:complete len:300 (-) Transcript_5566:755-1654(-)